MAAEAPYPLSDLTLSRRLERAEGRGSANSLRPERGSFPTAERPGSRSPALSPYSTVRRRRSLKHFGLGLFATLTATDLDAIEKFFRDRGAPAHHEVSPLADAAALTLLTDRGYRPFEYTSMLYRPIWPGIRLTAAQNERIRVRPIGKEDVSVWSATAARGWSEIPELEGQVEELGQVGVRMPGAVGFLAELNGEPIATGNLIVGDGVAILTGACTVPEARKQGCSWRCSKPAFATRPSLAAILP